MNDYKLKVVLSVLGGVMFALIIIIMAMVLPTSEKVTKHKVIEKPQNRLQEIAKEMKK